ncbi:CBS domain-containing protein [Desulfonema ishimotonii]|uniref:CBS domain-containing protein n=1 Tax=Desulfonema ishimotonii TaxID=45657 RepID=A0A401G0T3_9BACT|nr:CBS and ACT domain-containing protein [Desulfonema ishimotonii]GBC62832.1 CBS domain-containing protein [Desulfonema ishimotonii]
MFIDKSMTRRVVTISRDTSLLDAKALMDEHHIRHLPVIEADGTLAGIVTDRDIRSATPSIVADDFDSATVREKLGQIRAEKIMSKNPTTVSPTYTIQDALLLIQEARVGAFPVVDKDRKLVGIISIRDLLRAFVNVMGIGEPGTLLGILVEDKVGQLKRIVDAITEENISFGSVLVARYWDESKRAVFPYLLTNNVVRIKRKLTNMGYTLLDPMEWYLDRLPKNE